MSHTNGTVRPNDKAYQAAQKALGDEIKKEWAKRMKDVGRRHVAALIKKDWENFPKRIRRRRRRVVLSLSSMALFFLVFAVGVFQGALWTIVGIDGFVISAIVAEAQIRKVRR